MSNSDHLVEETVPVPRGVPRDSQSPRANRDSTEDALAYAKGEVQFTKGSTGRVAPENEGAEKLFNSSGRVKQDRGGDAARGV
jgi:hypothetical protein